jgi:DNA repair exonuclease SbcCD ATPase subunit
MAESILDSLKASQETLAELQQKEQRRVGRLEQVMKSAKEKFGVESLEEAQEKLAEISELVAKDDAVLETLDVRLKEIIKNAGDPANVG